jgi:hypothetical protein
METLSSITAFTRARHLFRSWARSIQSTRFQPISLIIGLILHSHVSLGYPSCLSLPQDSPPKPCMYLSFAPCVPHAPPISFFFIWSSGSTNHAASHCSFLLSLVTLSLCHLQRPILAQSKPVHSQCKIRNDSKLCLSKRLWLSSYFATAMDLTHFAVNSPTVFTLTAHHITNP